MRKLPEFFFWKGCCSAVLLSMTATFFSVFDLPVYWPILVMYFAVLFGVTCQKQIGHMLRHGYVPFNLGKKHYSMQEPLREGPMFTGTSITSGR